MSREKIIDYIMTTPNNTNLAILNQMFDEMGGGESTITKIEILNGTYNYKSIQREELVDAKYFVLQGNSFYAPLESFDMFDAGIVVQLIYLDGTIIDTHVENKNTKEYHLSVNDINNEHLSFDKTTGTISNDNYVAFGRLTTDTTEGNVDYTLYIIK